MGRAIPDRRRTAAPAPWTPRGAGPVWKSKFYGAFVLNHRVVLHAIDATPARRRGDAGSSPLDRAPVALIDFHTGIHILKPFLEPVQRLLLGLLLPLRALRALSNGRADPVATATLAAACLAVGLGTMIYAHFIHSYVMWLLGWFLCGNQPESARFSRAPYI